MSPTLLSAGLQNYAWGGNSLDVLHVVAMSYLHICSLLKSVLLYRDNEIMFTAFSIQFVFCLCYVANLY